MILRRLGNKKKLANKIQGYFPEHKIYIEPFFGAGGMFFNKPKAKYNILNDNDSDVFNLFMVVIRKQDELKKYLKKMPISEDLWNYWKLNQEIEPILKAIRFLFLSNFGYMGKPETLRFNSGNTAELILKKIDETHDFIFGSEFMNTDFRNVFKKISFKGDKEKMQAFSYCDPPYLDTNNNYQTGFKKSDSFDLFNALQKSGIKWAMSEFNHPFILKQARKRNLNINILGERRNLKNRRIEILITNYDKAQGTLF